MEAERSQEERTLLQEWVEKYSDLLYGWALQRVKGQEQASDLVQETFYAAMKSEEALSGIQSPKSWLFSILKRKIIDHYRKKKSRGEWLASDDEDPSESEDADFDEEGDWSDFGRKEFGGDEAALLDDPEFLKALDACYQEMPEKYRVPLMAKYQEGRDGNEIRQEAGLSSSNYWQIIRRAKLKLRDCLQQNWFNKAV
jgi:RNA polymerase sigma-70 factor (TIGR02943 family)